MTAKKRRLVIFLGAGASAPFGFPLTTSILTKIWDGLQDGSWKEWGGLKVQKPAGDVGKLRKLKLRRRAADARKLHDLLLALLPGLETPRAPLSDGASIVDVLSLLDQLLVEKCTPTPDLSEEDVRRARVMLQIGINGVLQGRKERNLRNRLVAWLLSVAVSRNCERVTIISANYDTAIELKLFDHLIDVPCAVSRCVDLGIPWRDSKRKKLHLRPNDAPLAVFKVHGSLNWLRCETCGHVSVNLEQRIATLEFWPERLHHNECDCGGRLRSILVTPSTVRDIRDANLLSIWNAALEDLRKADEWLMIGYSLPSEDIAIRSMLLRAFHTHVSRETLKVVVVQLEDTRSSGAPPSVGCSRYMTFFPATNLRSENYHTMGVEGFAKQLRPLGSAALKRRLKSVFGRGERG